MQKVFVHNFDNLTNLIFNDHDYAQTQNINDADIIVVIVDKNDDTKIIDKIKPLVTNEDKHKVISVVMQHVVQQTSTISMSDVMEACCYTQAELMSEKFVILPTVERPNVEILQKQTNKQQFITPNQHQYKQIRQIPKQICYRNQTRCK